MDDLEKKLETLLKAGIGAVQTAVDKSKEVIADLAESGEETYNELVESGKQAYNKVKQAIDENEVKVTVRKKADRLRSLAGELVSLSAEERDIIHHLVVEGVEKKETQPAVDEAEDAPEKARPGFVFAHNNINVIDLQKSLDFYQKALGLVEVRRKERDDFTLVYLGDGTTPHSLELTWLKNWPKDSYNLGDNEFHLAFSTDDYEAAHALHQQMGCICYENPGMGIYFISDPDGYWLEIVPKR